MPGATICQATRPSPDEMFTAARSIGPLAWSGRACRSTSALDGSTSTGMSKKPPSGDRIVGVGRLDAGDDRERVVPLLPGHRRRRRS